MIDFFFFFVIALTFNINSYSQSGKKSDPVAISLEIIGKGTTDYYKESANGYFASATVTNTRDTTIRFWVMSCSWPGVNFLSSNNSVYFIHRGCDNNSPDLIELAPGKSVSFYGIFTGEAKSFAGKKVSVGFVYFDNMKDLSEAASSKEQVKKFKTYWSNSVELEDNLFTYKKED